MDRTFNIDTLRIIHLSSPTCPYIKLNFSCIIQNAFIIHLRLHKGNHPGATHQTITMITVVMPLMPGVFAVECGHITHASQALTVVQQNLITPAVSTLCAPNLLHFQTHRLLLLLTTSALLLVYRATCRLL